jgi:hypothetical protein
MATQHIQRTATLVGRPDAVANVLVTARNDGRLVQFSQPAYLPDGRVRVDLVTWEALPARRSNLRRTVDTARRITGRPGRRPVRRPARRAVKRIYARARPWFTVAALAAGLAALGGLAWVVYLAYLWVVAHLAIIIGTAVLALIVAGLAGSAGNRGHWHHGRGC